MKTAFGSYCARSRLAGALVVIGLLPGCVGPKHPIYESKLTTTVGSPIYPQQNNPPAVTELTVNPRSGSADAPALRSFTSLPLSFEINYGQTDPEVKFISRGSRYTLFLTANEAVLALYQTRRKTSASGKHNRAQPEVLGSSVLRMRLVGSEADPEVVAQNELPGKSNYFIGNDPEKWRTNVSRYKRVKYHEVYPGIDLVYYGNHGQLEYDFIVAPGADPKVIQMVFIGADTLNVDDHGTLIAHAGGAEVRLQRPCGVSGDRRKAGEDRSTLRDKGTRRRTQP